MELKWRSSPIAFILKVFEDGKTVSKQRDMQIHGFCLGNIVMKKNSGIYSARFSINNLSDWSGH